MHNTISFRITSANNKMNQTLNAPVFKPVKDNAAMKNVSTKPLVRCNDCNLEFTSITILDAHLQGSKHAKLVSYFYSHIIVFENFYCNTKYIKAFFVKDQVEKYSL